MPVHQAHNSVSASHEETHGNHVLPALTRHLPTTFLQSLPHGRNSIPPQDSKAGGARRISDISCYTPKPDRCPPKSSPPNLKTQTASLQPFSDLFTKTFYQKFSSHRVGDTPCSPSSKQADPSGGCWVGVTVSRLLSLCKYLNSIFYFSCHISFIGSNFHLVDIIYTLF